MNYNFYQIRQCLWCEAPITGRADKKFCCSSCKAHYSRAITAEPVTGTIPKRLDDYIIALTKKGHIWNMTDSEDEKWTAILALARESQAQNDQFHFAYATVVEQFLREEEIGRPFAAIDQQLEAVLEAIEHYLAHPGLRNRGHIAHRRLFNLYLVHDYLLEQREGMEEVVKEYKADVSSPNPEDVSLYIGDRSRRNLWANLIGTGLVI